MKSFETKPAFLYYLRSLETAQQFLSHCYEPMKLETDTKSYENANSLFYFINQGITYYEQGKSGPLSIRPVLFFYGMTHFIKACLLTIRPHYPESTAVLAHGVSTRKRKKQNYSFLQDEVKMQQNGLLTYMAEHLFQMKNWNKNRFVMRWLFEQIPELNTLFEWQFQKKASIHIGTAPTTILRIPAFVCDEVHLTKRRVLQELQSFFPDSNVETGQSKEWMELSLKNPPSFFESHPLKKNELDQGIYLPLNRTHWYPFHEIIAHYLLLYNLSTICRYETEWWGELIHTSFSEDIVWIESFLEITSWKFPLWVNQWLLEKRKT
ncbi:YaaC family protein [Bacillaceae bacterium S4-13-56]